MQEPRVTKPQAIRLKNSGFDWKCRSSIFIPDNNIFGRNSSLENWNRYDDIVSIPKLSDAVRWLREVKGWHVCVGPSDDHTLWTFFAHNKRHGMLDFDLNHPTHDTALSAGIDAVLEQIEKEVENG